MSGVSEWGPWIEHDGCDLPVPDGTYLQVYQANGRLLEGIADDTPCTENECNMWCWEDCRRYGFWDDRAICYRIRRPKALRDLIELVENLPAPAPVRLPEEVA